MDIEQFKRMLGKQDQKGRLVVLKNVKAKENPACEEPFCRTAKKAKQGSRLLEALKREYLKKSGG